MLAALFAVPPMVAGVLAISGRADIDPITAGLLMILAVVIGTAIMRALLGGTPATPGMAVALFMQRLATRDYGAACRLVVNGDKDGQRRHAGGRDFTFESLQGFAGYWDTVLALTALPLSEGRITMDPQGVHYIEPDLATVTFSLPGADGAPGPRYTKVVVRVEEEWRIFNGALGEVDERDLNWTVLPKPELPGRAAVLAAA